MKRQQNRAVLTSWQACFLLGSLVFLLAYGVARYRYHQMLDLGVRLPGKQLYPALDAFLRIAAAGAVGIAAAAAWLFRRRGLALPSGFLPFSGRWSGWGLVYCALPLLALPAVDLPPLDPVQQMQVILYYLFILVAGETLILFPTLIVWLVHQAVRSRRTAAVPPAGCEETD